MEDKLRLADLVKRAVAVEVTGKMDGSMGLLFWDGARWRVSTKGSFASSQGGWATAWANDPANLNQAGLRKGWTYLVEIIYSENRIVVPYAFSRLVLLSAFREDGTELRRAELEVEAAAAAPERGRRGGGGGGEERKSRRKLGRRIKDMRRAAPTATTSGTALSGSAGAAWCSRGPTK